MRGVPSRMTFRILGIVTATARLAQHGAIGSRATGRRQMAHATRLPENLATEPLLVVEGVGRLLCERARRSE